MRVEYINPFVETSFRVLQEVLGGAEVKRGDLAECDGKPADNKDVDLYIWSDPQKEDYQQRYTLSYEDLSNPLACRT